MRKGIVSSVFLATVLWMFYACASDKQVKKQRYIAEGMVLYNTHCVNCHQADGSGFEKLIPPLNDTSFLLKSRSRLPCIIKNGMKGKIVINGVEYDQPMIGNPALSDMEIAEILTYVTNSFGNQQEMFTTEEVSDILSNCQ